MFIGLLMLLAPTVIYVITYPLSERLKSSLRTLYRIIGGLLAIAGSGFSLYLAAYTGDQGGIGAFFFQSVVIAAYVLFSILIVAIDWFASQRIKGNISR